MKEGPKSPDYEVATELWIDEEIISEKELRLIETVLADIVRMVLNNEEIEEENEK
jgi:dihydroneopterin aldolase